MCEKDAYDYTDNEFIVDIFNQTKEIYNQIIKLIPRDISGYIFEYESETELKTKHMIKYVNIISLNEIKNNVEQFVNSDTMLDKLMNTLNNINPNELGLNRKINQIEPNIMELVNKYHVNIINSSDVIIQPKYNFSHKKTYTARSIVNSHFVELHVTCVINSKLKYDDPLYELYAKLKYDDLVYELYAESDEEANNKCIKKINQMIDTIWPDKNKVYLEEDIEDTEEIKVNTIIV